MSNLFVRGSALALGLAAGLAAGSALAADSKAQQTVAVVNGTELKGAALAEAARQIPPQLGQAPYEALLDIAINRQLVLDQAKKEKMDADPEVKAALKQAEAELMRQAWLIKKSRSVVNDQAVRARYDQLAQQYTPAEEVHARHILVETEDAAKAVIAELAKGADFAELAKARSKDPSGAHNGGDLGYFSQKDMVPEFASAAFAMSPGEVSKTPVKTQFGFHVIKVEDKRMGQLPDFEQVKAQIAQQLTDQAAQKIFADLRAKASIKRFGPDGQPLADAPAGK